MTAVERQQEREEAKRLAEEMQDRLHDLQKEAFEAAKKTPRPADYRSIMVTTSVFFGVSIILTISIISNIIMIIALGVVYNQIGEYSKKENQHTIEKRILQMDYQNVREQVVEMKSLIEKNHEVKIKDLPPSKYSETFIKNEK